VKETCLFLVNGDNSLLLFEENIIDGRKGGRVGGREGGKEGGRVKRAGKGGRERANEWKRLKKIARGLGVDIGRSRMYENIRELIRDRERMIEKERESNADIKKAPAIRRGGLEGGREGGKEGGKALSVYPRHNTAPPSLCAWHANSHNQHPKN